MKEVQFVVSLVENRGNRVSRSAFTVKVGLREVGQVYLIPSGWPYKDTPEHHGRWVFEGDICSLDEELNRSYDTRMEAVFAMLSRLKSGMERMGA